MNNAILNLYVKLQNLTNREEGQDLVEYALLITLVALAAVSGINGVASAINGAIVNCLILRDSRTASVATILSVKTSFSIGEAATRATAPPDNTPCVT